MLMHLPVFINPLQLADKGRTFKGEMALSELPRLEGVILNPDGRVDVEISFGRAGKISAVTGHIDAALELQCQCCLEPLAWPVHSELNLAVVTSLDEAHLLPEPYEPLWLERENIALRDIIEEELVLALPVIPQHVQCGSGASQSSVSDDRKVVPLRDNPFAVLNKLK